MLAANVIYILRRHLGLDPKIKQRMLALRVEEWHIPIVGHSISKHVDVATLDKKERGVFDVISAK